MRNLVPGESGDTATVAEAITGQLIRQLAERVRSLRLQHHLWHVLNGDPDDQATTRQTASDE
ncbi:MAG: hypothetical protein JOY82_04405 [Streptosporangiaceae bacterium]|nr:hypothetical protein [Streptosporangiaceae bacterium]MBV9853754.1 hypothetical protein [Streptosporangiaceae bacterium]